MFLNKCIWVTQRVLFIIFSIACAFTGGLVGFLFAPIVTVMFFRDIRFWKYLKYFIPITINLWRIMYLNLTNKQYREMFVLPISAPPMVGPDQSTVKITKDWTTGSADCFDCQRCCTKITCPLLDHETGFCRSYNSFFWRYFNCGRYPLNQKQIEYYECPKWEMQSKNG